MTQPDSGSPQVTDQASQLSAMFDGALPAAECELLAMRVSSDPALQRQWSRYALVGAVLRGEPICERRAGDGVASRVQAALAHEVEQPAESPAAQPQYVQRRWARPLLASGIAAGVAVLSLAWLQRAPGTAVEPGASLVASVPAGGSANGVVEVVTPAASPVAAGMGSGDAEVVLAPAAAGEADSYIVPALPAASARPMSSAQLANFVVAHSEFSGSLSRRSVLSALVAGDGNVAADAAPAPVADPSAAPEAP